MCRMLDLHAHELDHRFAVGQLPAAGHIRGRQHSGRAGADRCRYSVWGGCRCQGARVRHAWRRHVSFVPCMVRTQDLCAVSNTDFNGLTYQPQAKHASNMRSTCLCCRTDAGAPSCMSPLSEQSSERFHRPWCTAKVLPLQQAVVPLVRLLHADLAIRNAAVCSKRTSAFASVRRLDRPSLRSVAWNFVLPRRGKVTVSP